MPTKTDSKEASGIFASLTKEAKEKLSKIDKRQAEIEKSDREALDQYQSTLQRVLEGKEDVKVSELSKLDTGIQRGTQYKQEITELAQSLTTELNELGQFFGGMSQYKGIMEGGLAMVGLSKWADRARLRRVRSSDVKQNLETILDYGTHMVKRLYGAIIENIECHAKIQGTIELTTTKLSENQPKYEDWRSQRETHEREMGDLEGKLDLASGTEYTRLNGEKTALTKKLQEAKMNEDYHFTIVDKAKKAIPMQRTHLQAYSDIANSLTQLKTGLEQDMEHVTQVFLATPTAIQTALATKAGSQYDKGLKYATDVSTDLVLQSAAGILDEVATRAERPLIEPEKLKKYREEQMAMKAMFESRIGALKTQYASPAADTQQQ